MTVGALCLSFIVYNYKHPWFSFQRIFSWIQGSICTTILHFLAYSNVGVDNIALCHLANENYVIINIKTCQETSLIFWKHVIIFQCSVHFRCNCHLTTLYLQLAFQGSWSLDFVSFLRIWHSSLIFIFKALLMNSRILHD